MRKATWNLNLKAFNLRSIKLFGVLGEYVFCSTFWELYRCFQLEYSNFWHCYSVASRLKPYLLQNLRSHIDIFLNFSLKFLL